MFNFFRTQKPQSLMIWCINIIHMWWGFLFIKLGELPANFGGTHWFYENGNAQLWGPLLILISVMSIIGMLIADKYPRLGFFFIMFQQAVLVAAAWHALQTIMVPDPAAIPQLAATYIITMTVFHTWAILRGHTRGLRYAR